MIILWDQHGQNWVRQLKLRHYQDSNVSKLNYLFSLSLCLVPLIHGGREERMCFVYNRYYKHKQVISLYHGKVQVIPLIFLKKTVQ